MPAFDHAIPQPPFHGSRVLDRVPLPAVLPYLNRTALYRFQWGYKGHDRDSEAWRRLVRSELDPLLARLVRESEAGGILEPRAVYGFFAARSDGDDLVVYADPEGREARCRFSFPRQGSGRGLCISDFFRPLDSPEPDVVAFQLVTVGQRASDHARALFETDRYQEYLYWHGLNAEGAEALAEYVHRRVRVELGIAGDDAVEMSALIKQGYRGSRYSFGYPACPDMSQQRMILELLDADRINVALGDEDQLWPEESTSAIVVHHPEARYFGV